MHGEQAGQRRCAQRWSAARTGDRAAYPSGRAATGSPPGFPPHPDRIRPAANDFPDLPLASNGRVSIDTESLVLLPDGLPPQAYSAYRVAEPVAGCGLGHDIVPCSLSEFRNDRGTPGTLVHNAVTEGRAIYRAPRWRRAERSS